MLGVFIITKYNSHIALHARAAFTGSGVPSDTTVVVTLSSPYLVDTLYHVE